MVLVKGSYRRFCAVHVSSGHSIVVSSLVYLKQFLFTVNIADLFFFKFVGILQFVKNYEFLLFIIVTVFELGLRPCRSHCVLYVINCRRSFHRLVHTADADKTNLSCLVCSCGDNANSTRQDSFVASPITVFTPPTRTRQNSSKLGRDETKLSCRRYEHNWRTDKTVLSCRVASMNKPSL